MLWGATPQANDMINQCDKSQQGEEKRATPHNIRGNSIIHNELGHIHSDRISQAQSKIYDSSDLQLSDSSIDQSSQISKQGQFCIQKSWKDRKQLANRNDPLSCRRSGTILANPLFKQQRKYLQSIPKATISHYMENRE
jgi:hypothetical protein